MKKDRQPPITLDEQGRYRFLHEVGVCAVTGRQRERLEVAHIRCNVAAFHLVNPGVGAKPHWLWTLPLAASEHRRQHEMGTEAYFEHRGWPLHDYEAGPLVACLTLAGFHALDDAEIAGDWLGRCFLERSARRLGRPA